LFAFTRFRRYSCHGNATSNSEVEEKGETRLGETEREVFLFMDIMFSLREKKALVVGKIF